MPSEKAEVKRSYDKLEVSEASSSHTMNGSSTNISRPLTRCRIDTHPQPAAGNVVRLSL